MRLARATLRGPSLCRPVRACVVGHFVVSSRMREWGGRIGVLAALAGLMSGCSSPSTTASAEDMTQPGSGSSCLTPPWTPASSGPDLRVSQCNDERVFRFVVGSGPAASDSAQSNFLLVHGDKFQAISGVTERAIGLCCDEDHAAPNTLCLMFGLRLCSTRLPTFIDVVRALQARDSSVANHSLRVSVTLHGLTGPRCEAASEDCGPLPYLLHSDLPVPEPRMLVDPPKNDSEPCSHDGECIVNGCGNECDHWTLGGAAGTCPGLTRLEDAFCGCVQDHCAWFH